MFLKVCKARISLLTSPHSLTFSLCQLLVSEVVIIKDRVSQGSSSVFLASTQVPHGHTVQHLNTVLCNIHSYTIGEYCDDELPSSSVCVRSLFSKVSSFWPSLWGDLLLGFPLLVVKPSIAHFCESVRWSCWWYGELCQCIELTFPVTHGHACPPCIYIQLVHSYMYMYIQMQTHNPTSQSKRPLRAVLKPIYQWVCIMRHITDDCIAFLQSC